MISTVSIFFLHLSFCLSCSAFLSTAQAIAAFSMPTNRYKEQMDYMVQEYQALQRSRPSTVLDTVSSAASTLLSNFFASADPSHLWDARRWDKTLRAWQTAIAKRWERLRGFGAEESDDDEEDVDIDQIEEIARQRLLEENPELAQQMEEEQSLDGSFNGRGGAEDLNDEESFGSLQDGDQVVPF